MKSFWFIIASAISALLLAATAAPATPPPSRATCNITCTVADIAEWSDESFPPIQLGQLTPRNNQTSGSSSLVLYANGDVEITADNSLAAQLSKDAVHKLTTEYKLQYDASADQAAGIVDWIDYESFLDGGSTIPHVPSHGATEVVLSVRATHDAKTPPAPGIYQATQTLTVCWK